MRGQDLWVLAVGKITEEYEPLRPNVKYIGNMHGNEVVSREVLLHLIEHFVTEYSTNTTIQQYLNTTFVHIMPSMNPDGYDDSMEGDCDSVLGRHNHNGYDLNRNFPEVIGTNPQPKPVQIETQAIIDWIHNTTFVLSANLHGGEVVANYPLDRYYPNLGGSSVGPDDDTFRYLSLTYSKTHFNMSTSSCGGSGFTDGITNGAEWYPVYGGMQDYNYLAVGTFEITLEISCCKFPYGEHLQDFWDMNKDALINYLLEADMGVKGFILDENNNTLADITLVIVEREFAKFRSSASGTYFRPLLPGTYQIQATHKDYATVTKEFMVVSGSATRLDISMEWISTDPNSAGSSLQSHTSLWIWSYVSLICFSLLSVICRC